MVIFAVESVEKEPKQSVVSWSVREVAFVGDSERTRHLVGYVARRRSGRVTSAIKDFDKEKMTMTTARGRIYHLEGPPGFSNDGEYVWEEWKRLNEAIDEIDVSDQFILKNPKND